MKERTDNVWCGIVTRKLVLPRVTQVNGNVGGFTYWGYIYKDAFSRLYIQILFYSADSVISLYILAFANDSLGLQKSKKNSHSFLYYKIRRSRSSQGNRRGDNRLERLERDNC
ncbi:hypothetical protein ABZP36_023554 [Zizania latifolia]